MSAESSSEFRSPKRALARSFRLSRERWKEKATQRRQEIRALKVHLRDLEASRDLWKLKALHLQQQLDLLSRPAEEEERAGRGDDQPPPLPAPVASEASDATGPPVAAEVAPATPAPAPAAPAAALLPAPPGPGPGQPQATLEPPSQPLSRPAFAEEGPASKKAPRRRR